MKTWGRLLWVLILVLMEYGLWRERTRLGFCGRTCLNPCSNGIWSLTKGGSIMNNDWTCLNPCSNGIWSLTHCEGTGSYDPVCLNPCSNGIWSLTLSKVHYHFRYIVLILVLMEYGLWLPSQLTQQLSGGGLNPCSNGIWSLTHQSYCPWYRLQYSLNPCSNGIWSLTGLAIAIVPVPGSLNPCSNGIWSLTKKQQEKWSKTLS